MESSFHEKDEVWKEISTLTICEILGLLKGVLQCSNKLHVNKELVEHMLMSATPELVKHFQQLAQSKKEVTMAPSLAGKWKCAENQQLCHHQVMWVETMKCTVQGGSWHKLLPQAPNWGRGQGVLSLVSWSKFKHCLGVVYMWHLCTGNQDVTGSTQHHQFKGPTKSTFPHSYIPTSATWPVWWTASWTRRHHSSE